MTGIKVIEGTIGDGILWYLEPDGKMYVEGEGAMPDYASAEDAPWYADRADITHLIIGEGITKVGAYSFMGSGIQKVDFASTVTEIGQFAFANSYGLIQIDLPENIQTIGDNAFNSCYIDRLIVPASLVTLGTNAFSFDTANIEHIVICWRGSRVGVIATSANAIVHEFSIQDEEKRTRTYTAGVPNCTRPVMIRVPGGWKVIDSGRMLDN